jgi:hypothetical protein
MINYKGRNNIEIINEYIYLINELFIGKEVVVEVTDKLRCYLFMGLTESDIELPTSCINTLINNSGIFKQDSGSLQTSVHVLHDKEHLKAWCNQQVKNYLLNEPDLKSFEPAIKCLRRINNLNKLLYNE